MATIVSKKVRINGQWVDLDFSKTKVRINGAWVLLTDPSIADIKVRMGTEWISLKS